MHISYLCQETEHVRALGAIVSLLQSQLRGVVEHGAQGRSKQR